MKQVFRRVALIAAIAVSAGAAQAEIIDFEQPVGGPTTPNAPALMHGDVFLQGSYYFDTFSNTSNATVDDLVGAMINGNDLAMCFGVVCPSNNLSTFYGALNDGAVAFSRMDGQSFAVNSFEASFIDASLRQNYVQRLDAVFATFI